MRQYVIGGLLGAALTALVFAGVVYVADLKVSEKGQARLVVVPNVVDQDVVLARVETLATGLTTRLVGPKHPAPPALGRPTLWVTDQRPRAGRRIPDGSPVTLRFEYR